MLPLVNVSLQLGSLPAGHCIQSRAGDNQSRACVEEPLVVLELCQPA